MSHPIAGKAATELGRAATPVRAGSNERVCVYDLGNGDFLACLPSRSGRTLWIDDWHEVPAPLHFSTVADVLEHFMSPARIDAQGRWYAGLD